MKVASPRWLCALATRLGRRAGKQLPFKKNVYRPHLETLEERVVPAITPDIGLFYVPSGTTKVTFDMTGEATANANEVGIFQVQDASGNLNGVAPSAGGYLTEFKNTTRTLVFSQGDNPSSTPLELTLDPGRYYAFYLVQNNTYSGWLSSNASNAITPHSLSNVFFSIAAANPDSATNHFSRTDASGGVVQFSLEDLDYGNINSSGVTQGGEPDFNDIVFTITPSGGPANLTQDCGCGCPPTGQLNDTAGGAQQASPAASGPVRLVDGVI